MSKGYIVNRKTGQLEALPSGGGGGVDLDTLKVGKVIDTLPTDPDALAALLADVPDGGIVVEEGVDSEGGISADSVAIGISRNLGETFHSSLPILDDPTIHLADGGLLSNANPKHQGFISHIAKLFAQAETYPNLFLAEDAWQTQVSTYGACGAYVYDAAAGTVRLPKLTGHVEGTVDAGELGRLVEAGLPNVEGSLYNVKGSGAATGAFLGTTGITNNDGYVDDSSDLSAFNIDFDASRSSPIYGNSTTVQTQSVLGYIYIVIGNKFEAAKADMAVPAGFMMPFAGNGTPAGNWLICEGAAVSRADYAALFAAIGTTYGEGDGSTTFNLPDMRDRFAQGGSTAGTVKEAGLPNITGKFGSTSARWSNFTIAEGAFYNSNSATTGYNSVTTTAGNDSTWGKNFDASRSSPIYGASDTVQPPALTMRYFIKY